MTKKLVIGGLIAALFVPQLTFAETNTDLKAQLDALETLLEYLDARVRDKYGDIDTRSPRRNTDPEVSWSIDRVTPRFYNDRRFNVRLDVDLGYPQPDRYRLQFECPDDVELELRIYGNVCDDTLSFNNPRHDTYSFDASIYTFSREWDAGDVEVRLTTYRNGRVDETDRDDLRVRSGDFYPDYNYNYDDRERWYDYQYDRYYDDRTSPTTNCRSFRPDLPCYNP